MTSFWTFVGVAASVALALPWDGASPTGPVVAVESLGWTPIPTQPPLSPYDGEMVPMAGKHIFARDYNDRLCGYLNGDSDSEWICPYSLATCTTTSGVFGCCYVDSTGIDCAFETMCIGAVDQSSCGFSCLSNTYMRKCTDRTAPFCNKYTVDDLSAWSCGTSSGLTGFILVNAAVTMMREWSVGSSMSSTVPSLTHSTSASAPSDSQLSQPTITGGAIAGSVIGGLAVVVLGGLGLFLVLSLRKKNAAAAAAQGQTAYQPGAPPAQPMIQQPPMQPMHPSGYPDQNWNNQVYTSAAQPQMMPQQQSHQSKYAGAEVTTPINGTPQYSAQPQQQYHPPQQQDYYAQQPQQPQQLAAPAPTELSDGQ